MSIDHSSILQEIEERRSLMIEELKQYFANTNVEDLDFFWSARICALLLKTLLFWLGLKVVAPSFITGHNCWKKFVPIIIVMLQCLQRHGHATALLFWCQMMWDQFCPYFTKLQPVLPDSMNCTMAKPHWYRNVVYCLTTVFFYELIHLHNMLFCDIFQCSTPWVIPNQYVPFAKALVPLLNFCLWQTVFPIVPFNSSMIFMLRYTFCCQKMHNTTLLSFGYLHSALLSKTK